MSLRLARAHVSRGEAAAIGAAAATAVLLVGQRGLPLGISLAAIGVTPIAWCVLARDERHGQRCDPRLIAVLVAALLTVAAVLPPRGSNDLWSYTMYGRMLSHHASSPYTHVPNDFPHDPFLHRVASGWRDTPSVYGPAFVVVAAAGSGLADGSFLAARLFHQILAAVAVAVSLALIWRRTRSPAALALLGINPLVVISVVNGGHNDALVGLAILGATLLATTRRPVLAGAVLGLGALIKITALLAIPALVAWSVWQVSRRTATRLAVTAASVVALGYATAGSGALAAAGANRYRVSRASPWQIPRSLLGVATTHPALGLSSGAWAGIFATSSLVLVGGIALATAWFRRRDSEPGPAVVTGLAAYLVLGLYTLPWYVAWILPAACLTAHLPSRRLAMILSTFLLAVYTVKARALPHAVTTEWRWLGSYLGPILVLLAFVVIAAPTGGWTPGSRRDRSTARIAPADGAEPGSA